MRAPLSGRGAPLGDFGVSLGAALGGRPRRARVDTLGSQRWPDSRAAIDIDFVQDQAYFRSVGLGSALQHLQLSGFAGGTRINSVGVVESVSAPALDWSPTTGVCRGLRMPLQRTNSIRNNTMVAAVAGSPGTAPTNWSGIVTVQNGIQHSVAAVGSVGDVQYVEVSCVGTATATTNNTINCETTIGVAAVSGQEWTQSAWLALVAGAFPTTFGFRLSERDGAGASTGTVNDINLTVNSTWQRQQGTVTLSNAATAYVMPMLRYSIQNGVAVNFTIRIGLPQLEQGAFATSVIKTSGAAVTRTAAGAIIPPAVFLPCYNADEGTFIVTRTFEAGALTAAAASLMVSGMTGGSIVESLAARFVSDLSTPYTDVVSATGFVNKFTSGSVTNITAGVPITSVFTYSRSEGYRALITNGSVSVDSSKDLPVCDRGVLLGGWDGVANGDGHIQRWRYIPRAIPREMLHQGVRS